MEHTRNQPSLAWKTLLTAFGFVLATNSFKVLGAENLEFEVEENVCEQKLDYLDLEECQAEAMLENRNPEECSSYYWAKSVRMEEYDSEKIVQECGYNNQKNPKTVTNE